MPNQIKMMPNPNSNEHIHLRFGHLRDLYYSFRLTKPDFYNKICENTSEEMPHECKTTCFKHRPWCSRRSKTQLTRVNSENWIALDQNKDNSPPTAPTALSHMFLNVKRKITRQHRLKYKLEQEVLIQGLSDVFCVFPLSFYTFLCFTITSHTLST